jgi:hypothetical protein
MTNEGGGWGWVPHLKNKPFVRHGKLRWIGYILVLCSIMTSITLILLILINQFKLFPFNWLHVLLSLISALELIVLCLNKNYVTLTLILLEVCTYKGHLVIDHACLPSLPQVSYKSPTCLLQVSYKSPTNHLQVTYESPFLQVSYKHFQDIGHVSWVIGQCSCFIGYGLWGSGHGSFAGS